MAFGDEYTSNDVHFIAGGRTLEFLKRYEWEKQNPDAALAEIAKEYGGIHAIGSGYEGASMLFVQPVNNPLFINQEPQSFKGKDTWYYTVNPDHPDAAALIERINAVPKYELGFNRFAKRFTGEESTFTNPDNLRDPDGYSSSPYRIGGQANSAIYRKYGDTFVVSVPRVVRGIFNEASAKLSAEERVPMAAGHTFEWFTPPDSQQIPYSKVIELREQSLGDQLKARTVNKPVAAFPDRKR